MVFGTTHATTIPVLGGGLPFDEDMPDDDPPEDPPGDDPPEDPPGGGRPDTVPLSALEKERARRQALEAKLAEREAAEEEARRKAAEEAGEYKTLYETEKTRAAELNDKLSGLQKRETDRQERVKASNDDRIARLPENLRALIPEGLDVDATAEQLRRLEALSGDDNVAKGGIGRGRARPGTVRPPAECAEDAKRRGKDPEWWFPIWRKTSEGRAWVERTGFKEPST